MGQMLDDTCKAHNNILMIDAIVLQFVGNFVSKKGTIYYKSKGCNHAVYLQACDVERNNYVVWTWGTTVNLTREMILGWPVDQPDAPSTRPGYTWNTGSVCGSITADQITIA